MKKKIVGYVSVKFHFKFIIRCYFFSFFFSKCFKI